MQSTYRFFPVTMSNEPYQIGSIEHWQNHYLSLDVRSLWDIVCNCWARSDYCQFQTVIFNLNINYYLLKINISAMVY